MKALKLALAISLALNLALVWNLWRSAPATPENPPPTAAVEDFSPQLPLPAHGDLLPKPPEALLIPSLSSTSPAREDDGVPVANDLTPALPLPKNLPASPASYRPSTPERPYSPPLPPNPHAVPLWEQRVPYRETQQERGLYPTPQPSPPTDEE